MASLYTISPYLEGDAEESAAASGKLLLIVKADEVNAETAVSLMGKGEHVAVHIIDQTVEEVPPRSADRAAGNKRVTSATLSSDIFSKRPIYGIGIGRSVGK